MRPSPVTATVDFTADGVQHGVLRLPHSRDGGNHGDEYEGPIALFDLARTLDPAEVHGTVIIVPALNYPAFRAGTRTSPIDRGNLNRSFPGRPDGTVTEKIADYVQRVLLPISDLVLDFHSGGRTLDFLPFCAAHVLPDKAREARCLAAVPP
jgi:N2-acetyl-L-2,4-diaminobutanoate deacetylase